VTPFAHAVSLTDRLPRHLLASLAAYVGPIVPGRLLEKCGESRKDHVRAGRNAVALLGATANITWAIRTVK
jgi:hypothetical protein